MNAAENIAESLMQAEIQAIVEATKLAGLGAKNLMALLVALAMDNGDNQFHPGAQSVKKLMQEKKPVTTFKIKEGDLQRFKQEAKDAGLAFHPLRRRDDSSGMYDIMAKAEDAAIINTIFERLGYADRIADDTKNPSGPSLSAQELSMSGGTSTANQRPGPDLTEVMDDPSALLANPDLHREYLEIQGRLPVYSERNQALINEQAPDASMVMSKSDWRACGRAIREGAAPITIKRPGFENGGRTFTNMSVYDISDTVGIGVPARERLNAEQNNEVSRQVLLRCQCDTKPWEWGDPPPGYDPYSKCIYVDSTLNNEDVAHQFIQAIAHSKLHDRWGDAYDQDAAKVVADCAAVQICASFDMDTSRYDLSNIAEWARNHPDFARVLRADVQAISKPLQCENRSKYKQLSRQKIAARER